MDRKLNSANLLALCMESIRQQGPARESGDAETTPVERGEVY
jgi:hypothetical protein